MSYQNSLITETISTGYYFKTPSSCCEEWLLLPYISAASHPCTEMHFVQLLLRMQSCSFPNRHLPAFTPLSPTASQTLMNSSSQNPPKLKWSEPHTEFKPQFQAYPVIMTAQLKLDAAEPDSACDAETGIFKNLIPNHRQLNTAKTPAWGHRWLIKYYLYIYV